MRKLFQSGGVCVRFGAVVALFALLLAMGPAAAAQALPAAEASPISTGFAVPRLAGSLNYAVSASESLTWGYYGNQGHGDSTSLSGDLAYLSNSKRDPFSAVIGAGHAWSTGGESSYVFLNGSVSQVLAVGRWNFVLSDGVSYLPGTAATGLSGVSGVAGVGDLGSNPNPVQVGAETGQGVLTNYSNIISNNSTVSAQRMITGKTSASVSASYGFSRFLTSSGNAANPGLDSDSEMGAGSLSHTLDARNSFGASYAYSTFKFPGNTLGVPAQSFVSQSASGEYSRVVTRRLQVSVSAGPQWTEITSANSAQAATLFASFSANYNGRYAQVGAAFVRSTNSGFGVVGGALSDSIVFSASRTFDQVWACAVSSSYSRTSSLPSLSMASYAFNTTVDGAQVSRAILRSLSIYASYTAEQQSSSGNIGGNAVNVYTGLTQVLGFGITYSPTSIHLGRQ